MAVTDSRVRKGVLKLTAAGGTATAKDFSCQVTAISIEPGVNESDPVEVLCGDKVGGGSTVNDTLNFTVISDHASADGLIAFSWMHRGETVDFEFQPDAVVANKWSGKVVDQALTVGGAVGDQITVDASWQIVSVTPPTGFGDGALHATPVALTANP
jgi:hypothetical protein